jgi:hypothetical protein
MQSALYLASRMAIGVICSRKTSLCPDGPSETMQCDYCEIVRYGLWAVSTTQQFDLAIIRKIMM